MFCQLWHESRATDACRLQADLDEIVSQDCPLCGEIAIRAIEEPFIPDVRDLLSADKAGARRQGG